MRRSLRFLTRRQVLIDTWWNVNCSYRMQGALRASFNRYMVECECIEINLFLNESLVLIDTWWNVNVSASELDTMNATVLIDTWWNVNSILISSFSNLLQVLIDTWWNVNGGVRMRVDGCYKF